MCRGRRGRENVSAPPPLSVWQCVQVKGDTKEEGRERIERKGDGGREDPSLDRRASCQRQRKGIRQGPTRKVKILEAMNRDRRMPVLFPNLRLGQNGKKRMEVEEREKGKRRPSTPFSYAQWEGGVNICTRQHIVAALLLFPCLIRFDTLSLHSM